MDGGLANAPSQGDFRKQLAVLTDLMRQIAGDAAVVAGDQGSMDPLNAPFALYVNPFIGSDKYVPGEYNSYESTGTQEEIIRQKLKRVEKQMLVCGYSPQRPFKTINRACLEAALITSKGYYTIDTPDAHLDCVAIMLSVGEHIVYNGPGLTGSAITPWTTDKDPTPAELQQFNPPTGSLIVPRYASLPGA